MLGAALLALGVGAPAAASPAVVPASAGDVVLHEDFSGSAVPSGWTTFGGANGVTAGGNWAVAGGRLVGTSTGGSLNKILFGQHLDSFVFEATVRFQSVTNSSRWMALVLDATPTGTTPWTHAALRSTSTAANGTEFAQRTAANTWNVFSAAPAPVSAGVGADVRVRIEVDGASGAWYLDDQLVQTTNSLPRSATGVMGLVHVDSVVQVDDITITDRTPTTPPTTQPPATEPPTVGDVVVDEHFGGAALPAGWNVVNGTWSVADGVLHGTTQTNELNRITFGSHLDNYRVEARMRFDAVNDAARWAGIMLDTPTTGQYPWTQAIMRSGSTASNGTEFAYRTPSNTWDVFSAAAAPTAAGVGSWVDVRVDVQGAHGVWYFDGQVVQTTSALPRTADGVLGLIHNYSQVSIDDLSVTVLPSWDDDPAFTIPPTLPPDTTGRWVRTTAQGPLTAAHRGYSANYPENTMSSFNAAIAAGADLIENDVYLSADGVPVVMHDEAVDRTTDGTGLITSMTAAQIATLDAGSWFSPAFAGEHVPTLAEQLDVIAAHPGKVLLLEVKKASYAQMQTIIGLIQQRSMLDQVLLQSFSTQVLVDSYAIEPDLDIALLGSAADNAVAIAQQYHLAAYNPDAGTLSSRPQIVGQLNAIGVGVMPWTVDSETSWASLDAIGVDAIITNRAAEHVAFRATTHPVDPPADVPETPIVIVTSLFAILVLGLGVAVRRRSTPTVEVAAGVA